jgi:hypothetical protein
MDDEARRRHVRAVLDAHDDAFRALRESKSAMGEATSAAETASGAMEVALQAHDDAIGAALRANRAALDLLDHLDGKSPQ